MDNWRPQPESKVSEHLLDRWVLSRLEWVRQEIENALDNYDATSAANAIITFSDELTNWYIRRSRRRFWKSEDDQDKAAAYNTLYKVLCTVNRLMAPFMPMVTETIFQNLERSYFADKEDSIHLAGWPQPDPGSRDVELEETMKTVRDVVTLARSLRNEGGIRVRQPLTEVVVKGLPDGLSGELEELILDELNVKNLRYIDDDKYLVTHKSKADFKQLGPRLGSNLKTVADTIANLDEDDIKRMMESGCVEIEGFKVSAGEIIVEEQPREGFWVRSEGDMTVAVAYRIDDELHAEWLAREFVHHVQNMRKEMDLEVTQRIKISFTGSEELQFAADKHEKYIKTETLALDLDHNTNLLAGAEVKVGDQIGKIYIHIV